MDLFGVDEDRLHGGVRRLQADTTARVAVELFQRDVRAAQQRDDHFAVIHGLSVLNDDVIAIADLLINHGLAPDAQDVRVALPHEVVRHGDGLGRRHRFNGKPSSDVAEQRELDRAAARTSLDHFNRSASIPGALDEAFFLQVRQVLMNRGERREAESLADFLEAGRVTVLLNELIEVVQDFALSFREREHRGLLQDPDYTQKKGEGQEAASEESAALALGPHCYHAGATVRIPLSLVPRFDRPFDAVGLGLNSVDLVSVVAEYPASNTKQRLQRFARLPGGQTATSIAVAARLGWRTSYIGRFGGDELGALSRTSLVEEAVDISASRTIAEATNQFAVVLVDARSGERTVLWDRHPALTMTPDDVSAADIHAGRLLLVDCHETAAATRAARYARDAGIPIVLDVEKVRPGIVELLQLTDAIIAAEAFPMELTGYDAPGRALEAIAHEFNAPLVAVTLGADGSLARCGSTEIRTPAFPVDCIDSTGAGDAFHGGFAAACLHAPAGPVDLEDALRYANAVAALNCRALGARGGMPTRDDVARLLAGHAPR